MLSSDCRQESGSPWWSAMSWWFCLKFCSLFCMGFDTERSQHLSNLLSEGSIFTWCHLLRHRPEPTQSTATAEEFSLPFYHASLMEITQLLKKKRSEEEVISPCQRRHGLIILPPLCQKATDLSSHHSWEYSECYPGQSSKLCSDVGRQYLLEEILNQDYFHPPMWEMPFWKIEN